MARVLYGYRMRMGTASVHAPEACVIIAILSFPEGLRCKAAREAAAIVGLEINPLTLKRLINRTLKYRSFYERGQIALDQLPREGLKLLPGPTQYDNHSTESTYHGKEHGKQHGKSQDS